MFALLVFASSYAMDVHESYVSSPISSGESTCSDVEVVTSQGCVAMPEFVRIASSTVGVGSPRGERGRRSDEKTREVHLSASYAVSRTEVTVGQYRLVMGATAEPSCEAEWGHASQPVTCVSWEDAVAFTNRLSSSYGLTPAYRVVGGVTVWDREANGFRLPTEVEWENAARADGETVYSGSERLARVAWSEATSRGALHQVAGLGANGWGLHDMSGNAAEWVWDAYAARPTTDVADEGWHRVIRGGSYAQPSHAQRVASRDALDLSAAREDVGFRIVRTLP
jgi:formylglycine-generating enzyme required for sulfatase activity